MLVRFLQNQLRAIPFEILRGGGLENFTDLPPPHFIFFAAAPPHILFFGNFASPLQLLALKCYVPPFYTAPPCRK